MAYVAPSVAREWHLHAGGLGSVFGAGLFGVLLGTLLIGPMADWFGRKRIVVAAVFIMAIFSFLTTQATTLSQLYILRFLTGLGLGVVTPSAFVITSEYAPHRLRGGMVTLMGCGYAIGAASSGLLAAHLLAHGWRYVFYFGSVAPFLLALALIAWLPESIRMLALNRADPARIAEILHKVNPKLTFPDEVEFTVPQERRKGIPVFQLFQGGRAWITPLLWAAFITNALALNFLNSWLPTIFNSAGIPVKEALRVTTLFQIGGMIGVIALGAFSDRFGFLSVLRTAFLLGSLFTAILGSVSGSLLTLAPAVFASGLFVIGTQLALGAFAATLYPTAIRSTGTSWGFGIGRIGSVSGPLLGAFLVSLQFPLRILFYIAAAPGLCGLVAILLMARIQYPQIQEAQAEASAQAG